MRIDILNFDGLYCTKNQYVNLKLMITGVAILLYLQFYYFLVFILIVNIALVGLTFL